MVEGPSDISFKPELIGRTEEMKRLKHLWDDVYNSRGRTVFISGEAGIGKTRLVEEFSSEYVSGGIVEGTCLSDTLQPMMPLRNAFRDSDMYDLISEKPPPRVISAYLMGDDGRLITKAEGEGVGLDPDVFASMLETVKNFMCDSLSMMNEEGGSALNTIGYGRYDILVQTLEDLSLAVVIQGSGNEFLIEDMRKILLEIKEMLGSGDGPEESILPKIAWLVESRKYSGEYLVDDPEIRQENLFDNMLLGIQRLSKDEPIVIFIDDLQWADPTTLKVIHYLARNTRESRVMILGTYRPEDIIKEHGEETHPLDNTLQKMGREDLFERIELHRLDRSALKRFIENTLGDTELEEGFVKEVYKESEGNPLFLLELMRLLVEEEHLVKEDGVWRVKETIDHIHIPSKVRDLVVRRLQRLMEEQRDILEWASVVGDEFKSDVLERSMQINRIQLLKNLNKIEKAHSLIHSLQKKYRFDHSKIRWVLYNGMNHELRQEYHRIVAESYEGLGETEDLVEHIAHHYHRAEDERAVKYLLDAGDKAIQRYAMNEAQDFYGKALSLIEEDEPGSLRVHMGLGDVYETIGRYEKALYHYKEALKLDGGGEVYRKIAQVFIDKADYENALEYTELGLSVQSTEDMEMCRLLSLKGWVLMQWGENRKALEVFEEGEKIAEKLGEKKAKADVLHNIGTLVGIQQSEFQEGIDKLEKEIEIRKEINDFPGLSSGYNNLGVIYSKLGDIGRAIDHFEKSLKIVDDIGDKRSISLTYINLGEMEYETGALDQALDYYERSLKIKREIADKEGINYCINYMGEVYRDMAMIDRALPLHQESLEMAEDIKNRDMLIQSLYSLAEDHLKLGEPEKALEYSKRALTEVEERGLKRYLSRIKRVYGVSYLEKGEFARAREILNDALKETLDRKEMKEVGKINYELGRLWKGKDDEKAREHFLEAEKVFEDIDMNLWVSRANEALGSI